MGWSEFNGRVEKKRVKCGFGETGLFRERIEFAVGRD
jgi:hypothetical protein